MSCVNALGFSILILICFIFSFLLKILFAYIHRNIFHMAKSYSFDLYLSIEFIYIDICQGIFVFALFKWWISILVWTLAFMCNCILFVNQYIPKKLFFKRYSKKLSRLKQTNNTREKTKESWQYKYPHLYNLYDIDNKDIKYTPCLGYSVKNNLYRWNWISSHTSAVAWILLISLLGGSEHSIFDWGINIKKTELMLNCLQFLGLLSLIYWVGAWAFCVAFRYEGWRKIYHICYFLFTLAISLLFLSIKSGVFL